MNAIFLKNKRYKVKVDDYDTNVTTKQGHYLFFFLIAAALHGVAQ